MGADSLEEILSIIKEALDVFAKLKEAWSQLLIFFDEMSVNIKTAMGKPIKDLCTTSKLFLDDKLKLRNRISWGRELLHEIVFESSTMSYIIQKQSGLYHRISKTKILPVVERLPKLLTLDPDTDQDLIERETKAIQRMVLEAQQNIKNEVDATNAEFLEKVKSRITNLSTLWDNLTISNQVVNDVVNDPYYKKEVNGITEKAKRYEEEEANDFNSGLTDAELETYDW